MGSMLLGSSSTAGQKGPPGLQMLRQRGVQLPSMLVPHWKVHRGPEFTTQ
jgi:hypothetical protein